MFKTVHTSNVMSREPFCCRPSSLIGYSLYQILTKEKSSSELLYSSVFLNGTLWGVVGHKHQCAFCVFFVFLKVLREGGVLVTRHTPVQSERRCESCTVDWRCEELKSGHLAFYGEE